MVRFKNRYFVIEIKPHMQSDKQLMLKHKVLVDTVQKKVRQLYGDFGLAAIKNGFDAKYCNSCTKIAIVRVRHGPHKFLLRAIPLINDIDNKLVKTTILYVGATMKHCFLFIRKHQEKALEQMWSKLQTDNKKKEMETVLMTLTPAMSQFK
ncbi:ribonuclease P/MRP protein subunit POP5 [Pseudomyrmex gracilis]|uniref:ribonuclease P/MRP protein subunit POP5 n=1 Tax=Pseudomyrmex gracilis TaxID=219809 RepID=UPI000995BFAA|nr:ribonuclease P/MRP protein subunit POP5 [Pseudomyrmex gracilis]